MQAEQNCTANNSHQRGSVAPLCGCGLQREPGWVQMPLTDLRAFQKLHLLPIMCPLPQFVHL